jgi:outer membrane lipoprotein-sorting protein
MAAATGWNSLTLPADVVATGTVTRYQGGASSSLTFTTKAKGVGRTRTELQNGATVSILNGDTGASVSSSSTQFIPRYAAVSMRPLTFPFYSDLVAAADPNVNLNYRGTETVGGQLAHRIEIVRQPGAGDALADARQRAGRLTVWVSASSWLPLQVEYVRIATDNPTATRSAIRTFADYRVVNGLAVPFLQEEFFNGQRLYTVQLTEIRFNVGLSDSEFTLPTAQP